MHGLLRRPKRAGRFRVGQRVFVEALGVREFATVLDISTDLERGAGTKLYPAFLVEFDDGSRGWFNGISLKPTRQK